MKVTSSEKACMEKWHRRGMWRQPVAARSYVSSMARVFLRHNIRNVYKILVNVWRKLKGARGGVAAACRGANQ